MSLNTNNLSTEERTFCELFVNGCAPYAGNAPKCYQAAFKNKKEEDPLLGQYAKEFMAREDVAEYIKSLEDMSAEEAKDMKKFLTANLMHIIEETAHDVYVNHRGRAISPAALRGVAVSASKALMEMYPVKAANSSSLNINTDATGITFNVIVPEQTNKE